MGASHQLALLLDREWSLRHDRKLAARLRFAKLRHQASPEDVDYRSPRTLDRALFMKFVAGSVAESTLIAVEQMENRPDDGS